MHDNRGARFLFVRRVNACRPYRRYRRRLGCLRHRSIISKSYGKVRAPRCVLYRPARLAKWTEAIRSLEDY